jgi:hypothetical protein
MISQLATKLNIKLIEFIIIFIFFLLFYFDLILIYRLKIFFFILLLLISYIILLDFFNNLVLNNLQWIKTKGILKFLIKIYVYKNFILIFLLKFDIKFFIFIRKLNYIFINYSFISYYMYILIQSFITPLRLLITFYYRFFDRLKQRTLTELIFKRIDGLIISILFLTHLIDYILIFIEENFNYFNIINIYFCYILLIYLLLIIISFFLHIFYNKNIVANILIKYNNLNRILELRLEVTILGIIIYRIIEFHVENNYQLEIGDYLLFFRKIKNIQYICKNINKIEIERKCIHGLISWSEISNEIKNKPVIFFYYYLDCHILCFNFFDLIYGMQKYKNNLKVKEKFYGFFLEEEKIFKYNIFKLWDIDKFLGYKDNTIQLTANFGYYHDIAKNEKLKELLKKNKEIFLDLENNFELYAQFYDKIDIISNKNYYLPLLELFKEYKIDYRDLIRYEFIKNEITKEYMKNAYYEELLPILQEMGINLKKYREEWENEWKDGKRSYIWKD